MSTIKKKEPFQKEGRNTLKQILQSQYCSNQNWRRAQQNNETYNPVSLMNTDEELQNKISGNWTQEHIITVLHQHIGAEDAITDL